MNCVKITNNRAIEVGLPRKTYIELMSIDEYNVINSLFKKVKTSFGELSDVLTIELNYEDYSSAYVTVATIEETQQLINDALIKLQTNE